MDDTELVESIQMSKDSIEKKYKLIIKLVPIEDQIVEKKEKKEEKEEKII